MQGEVKLKGTIEQVISARKGEGIEGKLVIKWTVRDFEKFSQLSEMQNVTVEVLIQDPQLDLFKQYKDKEQAEFDFDSEQPEAEPEPEPQEPLMLSENNGDIEDAEFSDVNEENDDPDFNIVDDEQENDNEIIDIGVSDFTEDDPDESVNEVEPVETEEQDFNQE